MFLITHCTYKKITCIGEKTFPLAWEVTEALEMFDMPVVSFISDGDFYYMSQQEKGSGIPFETVNPCRKGADLCFFCDVPHLLKTPCNCLSNQYAHSKSQKLLMYSCMKTTII